MPWVEDAQTQRKHGVSPWAVTRGRARVHLRRRYCIIRPWTCQNVRRQTPSAQNKSPPVANVPEYESLKNVDCSTCLKRQPPA